MFFFHFETTIELARKNAAPKVIEEDLCNHDTRVKYGNLNTPSLWKLIEIDVQKKRANIVARNTMNVTSVSTNQMFHVL